MNIRHIAGMNSSPENLIKACPPQMYCEHNLLTLLHAPTRPIHHPKEVGLDPTHAFEAEFTPKPLILHREEADGRAISLINHHCVRVELGEDAPSGHRPALQLFQIGFCSNLHFASLGSLLYSPITSIRPAMFRFISAKSSAGIHNSWWMELPTFCTGYRAVNSVRTANRVTKPAPLSCTFQSLAICRAYSSLSTG